MLHKGQIQAEASASLPDVVAALKGGLGDKLTAVVLFGSRARGDANEDSDWDLLLIARDLPERVLRRHLWLKGMLPVVWRGQATILAKTPAEFDASLPSLYLDIALDGILLYDTDRFLASRLARLRRLIETRGLRREASQRDLVWRWDRFPGFDWSLEWEKA